MASPPSSPSDSSVLAFTYDRGVHTLEYPHDHDQSQPQSPASARTAGPLSPFARRSRARAYSLSSLDPAHPASQFKQRQNSGDEEEYALGLSHHRRDDGTERMDPFSKGELFVMGGSSLMVLGLIFVAVTLTLGKYNL